ncbi:MAG: hypothetical protein ACOC6C_06825, partial [Verrucomicrobiota bacterium]
MTILPIVNLIPALLGRVSSILPLLARKAERRRKLPDYVNSCMLHTGRCGSQVLADMLRQHPHIKWYNEIFENFDRHYPRLKRRENRTEACLKINMATCQNKVFGFETKFLPEQQLRARWIGLPLRSYILLLQKIGFTRFILLRRNNYLRRAASVLIGQQTKTWRITKNAKSVTRVRINPEAFPVGNAVKPLLTHFRELDENYATAANMLRDSTLLELEYEKHILANPAVAYRMSCEFLDVEPLTDSVKIRSRKINPFPLELMIENYSEITSILTGT